MRYILLPEVKVIKKVKISGRRQSHQHSWADQKLLFLLEALLDMTIDIGSLDQLVWIVGSFVLGK